MNRGHRVEATPPECALAAEMFDHFCAAGTMKQILALHREICNTLNLRPNRLPDFYPKLKAKLANSWKAQALFKKFDARANHKVYGKGRVCAANKVLIIGAGPCGLRAAVECQLLGAKVVVIEKRDRMSRNNVLHLWPFVIQDLRALGAKKFFGKFCAGSIDHISIRQLQCILMKVALLLGVEFHEGVGFEELLEPSVTENSETLGWRARVSPPDHPVCQYEFDALLGADGKRNTLGGFKRKEFRGKLAMAITANFINRHSEQEASVPEISGVAFIFNQKFFKELYEVTGIDLENIVYYKDDTHYFVMTAKKHSLLDKGVLYNDFNDVTRLLSVENVDRSALMQYAQEAARFSTGGRLPLKEFALNHYGEPDVALFDFTSMYAAENASMVFERLNRRLLCQLVGDSLLEPFWPTGSGCARGFLSALDAAWAVRTWGQSPAPHPLEVIAERESIYRLLAQTTPENLHRDFGAYTLDPGTRYPNLNRTAVTPHRVNSFYDSDEPLPLDATQSARKRRREAEIPEEALVSWVGCEGGIRAACGPTALTALVKRYRPELINTAAVGQVYQILQQELGITPFASNGSMRDVSDTKLRSYLFRVYCAFKGEVPHIQHNTDVFHQIKQTQQKEKHNRNTTDHSVSVYSNAADAEKSHSSCRKKRRSRTPQVSSDPADYIRRKIGKLDLNDITQLAKLIEGHDSINETHTDKQIQLQEQIIALLDPEESPDPQILKETLATLLQGTTKSKHVQPKASMAHFFKNSSESPVKPPRRLKGLDFASVKVPDLSEFLDDSVDTDATVISRITNQNVKKKLFARSASIDNPTVCKRHSEIPDMLVFKRSNSVDSPKPLSTRQIIQQFESQKRKYNLTEKERPVRTERSKSVRDQQMALKMQRMKEIIDGKRQTSRSPEKKINDVVNIGNAELELRRKRVVDLVDGQNLRPVQMEGYQKQSSGEIAFKLQRVNEMMQRGHRCGGKRKAARQIMRQRFEKSLQMLATEPRMEFAPSVDLENDCGLQQYRANAPHFGDRVKKLEKKLQHYEEGRLVGAGSRLAGTGARVARLAAELSGTSVPTAVPKSSKPKDLMRSVGKIERDDWNVKEIERKIQENRLGRPEPKTAEKVPKWDREQFLGRQRRLKEGDPGEEKWGELDETLNKMGQKLRDSGRPDHGTKKVANLATKFVKKEEPQAVKVQAKEECKKSWRGPSSAGVQCAACGARVFAAEGVLADGLHLHRACFRCAVCKTVLRPGNYTMERYGSRLVCLRHSGIAASMSVLDCAHTHTPERISVELSDGGAREIDEDEWTDRNCLQSETSYTKPDSDEEQSSSDEFTRDIPCASPEPALDLRQHRESSYFSTDSFGYDDCSDSGGESSGNESCSRMREAREARRREVPADARPPTDSSEVESDEESEDSEDEVSSATEVSTDSEFARDEPHPLPLPTPPAILVTAPNQPHQEYPLSRARSAGGLATKRALELKRKYLLGEPSPPNVRKSDSTSQLDTKLQAFRSNITEFQKMLHPAPSSTKPVVTFQLEEDKKAKPMPDIIKNLCEDAPVDLLTKVVQSQQIEWNTETAPKEEEEKKETLEEQAEDLDSDSLSDSSHTETLPNQSVPRVEVHDEGGELIQLDSLMLVNTETEDIDDKASATVTGPTVVKAESESSESGRDATTLALTETELSDWAAESAVLDDFDDDKKRNKNPRTLSGPKTIHDATNTAIASHVCGKSSPEQVVYSNALEHFEFADEGEQDPSLETPVPPRNQGYMELVDDEYDPYSPGNDRSMNFIERSFSETVVKTPTEQLHEDRPEISFDLVGSSSDEKSVEVEELKSPNALKSIDNESSGKSTSASVVKSESVIKDDTGSHKVEVVEAFNAISLSEISSPLERDKDTSEYDTKPKSIPVSTPPENESPPLTTMTPTENKNSNISLKFSSPCSIRMYSPAICRSASVNFDRSSRSTDSPSRSTEMSISITFSSGSVSPVSPLPLKETTDKVQEIKREREEQTEVVRRLVLERLGSGRRCDKKSTRRARVSPSNIPPPVPPPPLEPPPPPPRPAPPLPVTPSFSDPELARDRRRNGIMKSISNYLNRRRGPRHKWVSEPDLTSQELPQGATMSAHKSTGALQEPPPVPPPPQGYRPPTLRDSTKRTASSDIACEVDERDAMQLWFEARWARLVAQRRGESPANRRVARLERRLARPLSAEQQAATVAELVQVSAQRDAHQALMAADRRRNAGGVGD